MRARFGAETVRLGWSQARGRSDRPPPHLLARGWRPEASWWAESGRPLEPAVRSVMEARLGHDFGKVRIHADERAARSARMLDALAYTSGPHVVFAAGRYEPHSPTGWRLLAHELGHVAEQQGMSDALPSGLVQRQQAAAPPDDIHVPVGDTRITLIPGPGPLRLGGRRLPLPGSLRLTNALGLGPGPTFVADLDPRQLVLHLLDNIDLSASTPGGTPPWALGLPGTDQQLSLVRPTVRLDLHSGRLEGWATLHVPSQYPAHLHPGTDVAVRIESGELGRFTATASYGPLVATTRLRLRYDTGRLLAALAGSVSGLGAELKHPGLSGEGTLRLGIPISRFWFSAPTTTPRRQPLLDAPAPFPTRHLVAGAILTPPGSLTSVPAPALGVTAASFGERSGIAGTAAILPTLSTSAIEAREPAVRMFPVLAYAEISYVGRVSDGFELGVRAIVNTSSADLLAPSRGLPSPSPADLSGSSGRDPGQPRPPLPDLVTPTAGVTVYGRFR